ncbi:hypothetical protein LCGC14_0667130 [marine sediment metagenome]|uniref:Uncharacterized protein n=1 Tax=marine sediment metagenome TaxID=412755 RepID=A0A0F9TDE9_9ZZZZ
MKSHKELVEIGYRWLLRTKPRNMRTEYSACRVAFKEVSNLMKEEPDVIGFRSEASILVECKATRQDFLSDKTKEFRKCPEQGMGQYRFYLVNKDVVETSEITNGWGLLVAQKNNVRILKDSKEFESFNYMAERELLTKLLNRIAYFNLLDLINDARYRAIIYEFDCDETKE